MNETVGINRRGFCTMMAAGGAALGAPDTGDFRAFPLPACK